MEHAPALLMHRCPSHGDLAPISINFNGITGFIFPHLPQGYVSRDERTPPEDLAPSAGLQPLNVSRVRCGGADLVAATKTSVGGKYDMLSMPL